MDDKLREEVSCLPRFYNKVTFSIKKDVKSKKKKEIKILLKKREKCEGTTCTAHARELSKR